MRSSPWKTAQERGAPNLYNWHEVYAWWPRVVRNEAMGLKVLVWREPIMRRMVTSGRSHFGLPLTKWQYTIPEWAD